MATNGRFDGFKLSTMFDLTDSFQFFVLVSTTVSYKISTSYHKNYFLSLYVSYEKANWENWRIALSYVSVDNAEFDIVKIARGNDILLAIAHRSWFTSPLEIDVSTNWTGLTEKCVTKTCFFWTLKWNKMWNSHKKNTTSQAFMGMVWKLSVCLSVRPSVFPSLRNLLIYNCWHMQGTCFRMFITYKHST